MLRRALPADIDAMHRVRTSVRENRLVSAVITASDYREHIQTLGRGWVVETDGEVVGFAIGNARDGNIWALFVDPAHERRGFGRLLHDEMIKWLWGQGLTTLWLTTAPGTRAEAFYVKAGWKKTGLTEKGEARFEQTEPRQGPSNR